MGQNTGSLKNRSSKFEKIFYFMIAYFILPFYKGVTRVVLPLYNAPLIYMTFGLWTLKYVTIIKAPIHGTFNKLVMTMICSLQDGNPLQFFTCIDHQILQRFGTRSKAILAGLARLQRSYKFGFLTFLRNGALPTELFSRRR